MTNFSFIDIFLRFIPESLLLISFVYIFSNKKIYFFNCLKSSFFICITCIVSKLLSGCYIMHVIFNIVICSIIFIKINKLDIQKSISLNIIYFLITLICENINLFLLSNLFNITIYVNSSSSLLNNLYGLPSLFLISLVVFLCYKFKKLKIDKDLDTYA